MKKRVLAIMMAVALVGCMTACGSKKDSQNTDAERKV